MTEKEPVETYFLKYAWPCTFILKMRGQVDEKGFRYLEKCALEGTKVDRKLLENTYKKAFARMKKTAKEMGKETYWDQAVVREYFVNRHNDEIAHDKDYQESPPHLQELCRTEKAKVADTRDGILVVNLQNGKTRTVSSAFVPEVEVGDDVIIHYGYAVEIA